MSTKSYVLITNLPPTLKGEAFFYKLLKKQIGGGLLGTRIEDESGKALAIFDNVTSALAACHSNIVFRGRKQADGTDTPYVARLRIVELETQARPVEDVFVDTIAVDGEPVKKDLLCKTTIGYQLALRGEQGAKWCSYTAQKAPCPLGDKCKFIHLREHQDGARKRLRLRHIGAAGGAAGVGGGGDHQMGADELGESVNLSPAELIGMPFAAPRLASFRLTPPVADALLAGDAATIEYVAGQLFGSTADLPSPLPPPCTAMAAGGDIRAYADATNKRGDMANCRTAFLRVESQLGGSTNLDWYTGTDQGIRFLRDVIKCTLPLNGAPTPPERDAFIREVLKRRNLAAAVHSQSMSPAERLRHFLESANVREQLAAAAEVPVRFVLTPRYDLTSVTQEVTIFMRDGLVVGTTQQHDNVLAPHNMFDDRGDLAAEMMFIDDRVREARVQLEAWAATRKAAAGGSLSAAFHVAFPAGVYKPLGDKVLPDPSETVTSSPAFIQPAPQSILFVPEDITPALMGGGTVVLGVKAYAAAIAMNTMFKDSAEHMTRTSRPLWRRRRTAPTPLLPRDVIDRFKVDRPQPPSV